MNYSFKTLNDIITFVYTYKSGKLFTMGVILIDMCDYTGMT
jgi:hypothetical protein